MYEERKKLYDAIVAKCPDIERKGKTMPYTSANGYMFSQLNKAGEIGMRFHKEDCKTFMEENNADVFKSYGATMRDYVCIPDHMLNDLDQLAELLQKSHTHALSLEPK